MRVPAATDPPPVPHSSRLLVLTVVGSALVTALVSAWSLAPLWRINPVTVAINVLVAVSFVATAVVLGENRDQRGTAAALALTCPFWLVSWWWAWPPDWQVGPAALISNVTGYLWFVVGGIGLLRYPESRLTRFERWYFSAIAAWICGVKIVLATLSEPEWSGYSAWSWWPTIAPDRGLFTGLLAVFYGGVIAFAVVMLLLLIAKLRRSRGMDRLDSIPVTAAASTVTVTGGIYLSARLFEFSPQTIGTLQTAMGVAALVTPLSFLMVVVRRRLARSAVADLVVAIASAPTLHRVQLELRRALQDPMLTVWVRDPSGDGFVDADGTHATRPTMPGHWVVTACTSSGDVLALVLLSERLRRHLALVEACAAAAGLALEVQSRIWELHRSRERIVSTAVDERRRLERDLHDGAQQSLLAVAARLSAAHLRASGGRDASGQIEEARTALQRALDELRSLARGIHPAVLSQSGLLPAVEAVAERLPLDVVLDIPGQRWPDRVESTVYFVVCEALANVVKHSGARRAVVRIGEVDGHVTVTVEDDGSGGADISRGTGLAGMRDRVRAIGGELDVRRAATGGTSIELAIPCA